MILENLLAEQGELPLTDKVNGSPLRAFINAELKKIGLPGIDRTTPCESILELIYGIGDDAVRTKLLEKPVAEVKSSLNYKRVLAVTAVTATIVVLGYFTWIVKGGQSLSADEVDLLKTIGSGAFDLLKEIFGKGSN